MRSPLFTALVPFLLLIAGVSQDCTGSGAVPAKFTGIYGTVIDPVGAVIANARITITDAHGHAEIESSSAIGLFCVKLKRGDYKVEVSARGFQTATRNIQVGDDALQSNFQLQISSDAGGWSGPVVATPIETEPADTSTSSLQSAVPKDVQKAIKLGIYGTVVDPAGAVIPRAHIVAVDQGGKSDATCSNSEGKFQMKLKRGSYQVSASAQGFRAATQKVEVTDVHELNFRLNVGSGSHVEVMREPAPAEPVRTEPCPK